MKAFWNGFLLSLSLCLDLGIVNVAVLRVSIRQGWGAGFLVGVGSCAGDFVYFALAVMGAAVMLEWAPVRWALWIFGTVVLLVMTWRMAREALDPMKLALEDGPALRESGWRLVATGTALALASPTAILWFAAVGGSVIASFGGRRDALWQFAAGFGAAGLVWTALFAYLAATLRMFGSRPVRAISAVSTLLFLYFAAMVFQNGLNRLVFGR